MRLALGNIDASGVVLELPAREGREADTLKLRQARALHGTLEQTENLLKLSDVKSEWMELDSAAIGFGSTQLTSTGDATFSELRARYQQTRERVDLALSSHAVHVTSLRIQVHGVDVQGELRLQETQLFIEGAEGRIEARHARIESLRLKVGELSLKAAELVADGFLIGWGPDGFRLEAAQLSGPTLRLGVGSMRLDAERASITALLVHGAKVTFSEASVESAQLEVSFQRDEAVAEKQAEKHVSIVPAAPHVQRKPIFDWGLLDGLSGALNVDAVVDMTVPIIGQRRATHKLRLSVEDGSIDYRAIENNLSALEESLLDFSVRDGALVLERGIPLLPTRGFGKRLLIWELSPEDLALALERRVRLSVLPSVQLAPDLAKANAEREPGSSGFALRRLGLESMDLKLSLEEVTAPIKSAIERLSFVRLAAYGDLQHELQGESRPGLMHAQIDALSTALSGLAIGSMRVDVKSLKLESLRDAALTFVGLSPVHLRVEIAGLALRGLSFIPDGE